MRLSLCLLDFSLLLNLMWAPRCRNIDGPLWFMWQTLLFKAQMKNEMQVDNTSEFISFSHLNLLLSQELQCRLWECVSQTSYFLHLKTAQSDCTSTHIFWVLSSLLTVSSTSPPQTKPKVCCTNLGKIQIINQRCLSSSCKHLKAPQELVTEDLPGSKRQKNPCHVSVSVPFPSASLILH